MNNMMRKNNNRNGGNKHRSGGARRYNNNGGGGNNRSGANDGQNLQRQKHHATQQLGKYSDMARNAQINGDRVDVEYYLQHVDHYTRVLTDIAAIEAERFAHTRESQIIPGGPNDPNAAQHAPSEQPSDNNEGGNTDQSAGHEAPQPGEFSGNQNQPRMTRQPRQPRNQQPAADSASDNGAREANSNTTDIPLPGSILPPI
jgi:hypothetical protein